MPMTTVAGLFANRDMAANAIQALREARFDVNRMGLVMRDTREPSQNPATTDETHDVEGVHIAGGTVAGGLVGGALGAILAATGLLVVPGIGSLVAAGILATVLAGGISGGLIGALVGLGIPHEQAAFYQTRVERGSVLVTVDAEGREQAAQDIMTRNGAENPVGLSQAATPETPETPERALQSNLPRTAPLVPHREIGTTVPAPASAERPPSGVADTTNTAPPAPPDGTDGTDGTGERGGSI